MKKASPHKRTSRPKLPGFFDHLFYWTWRSCRHGFPDRSFAVISVGQFACLLFPVAIALQFLGTPAVRFLYETDDRLTLFPLILPFPVLLWRNMRIYTEERYRMMHDYYGAFHVSVRQRYRLRFLVCMVLAVLAILLEIRLVTLYHDRCTAISSGNSHPASLYVPYRYDNGNDPVQEGVYRIVDEKGRIGYADEHGNTLVEPRFAFGFPFENGKAKVTDTGELEEAPGSDGEYHYWESDDWYYINRQGQRIEQKPQDCPKPDIPATPPAKPLQGKHEAAKPYRNIPFIPPFPRNKHQNSKPTHLQKLKRISVQAAKQPCVAGARCSYIYKYSCTLHHRNTH